MRSNLQWNFYLKHLHAPFSLVFEHFPVFNILIFTTLLMKYCTDEQQRLSDLLKVIPKSVAK